MKCDLFRDFPNRGKRQFDTDEKDLIKAAGKQFRSLQRAAQKTDAAKSAALADKIKRESIANQWIDDTGEVIRLFPEQGNRLEDFLVTMFGQKAKFLGLNPETEFTLAGEVRANLENFQAVAEGMVNIAGRIESVGRIRKFNQTLERVTKGKGMTDEQIALFSLAAREEGRIPQTMSNIVKYTTTQLGFSNPVTTYLKKKHQKFLDDAAKYGLDTEEVNDLIEAATELSTVFDEIRAVARGIGVDVPNLENLGYFARIITKDFKNRLKDIGVTDLFEQVRADIVELSSVFSRSRSTVHYIPYDAHLASQILGITNEQLELMLDNPTIFRKYLHEALDESQLDTLVDAGIFEKLPMSSREVYEYFTTQYELPYKSVSQMFIVDPEQAIQKYAASLQTATGTSALVRGVMDGRSFSAGWTVDASTVAKDSKRYADFVPLGDSLDNWAARANVSPAQALINLGLASSMGQASQIVGTFKNAYVHPVVARQWAAMMDLTVNPAMMSNSAFVVYKMGRMLNKLTISSNPLGYITNNTFGSLIQTVAAGGNILRFLPNVMDVIKALKYGFEVFDDTRVYFTDAATGKSYTRRSLVTEFMKHRGQSFAPGTVRMPYTVSTTNSFVKSLLDTPQSFGTALHEILTYTMASGEMVRGKRIPMYSRPGRFAKATLEKLSTAIEGYFSSIVFTSNVLEIAAKLTTLESIIKKPSDVGEALNITGQLLTSFQFTRKDSLQEAFRHLDEYFVNPYSIGTATAKVANFVFPFAAWRMSNPPMQVRHMLRQPMWYMSYGRLHALNQNTLSQDERAVDASIEPWVLESYPWYIGRDRQGQPLMLLPTTFDPIADAMVFFSNTGDQIGRMLGMKARRPAGERQDARNETTQDFINGFVSSTFLPYRTLYEAISGYDTFTGRKIDDNPAEGYPDFLGINMPPRLVLFLSKFPMLSKLDSLNPGGVFGTAGRTDSFSGAQITRPTPSIFGGTRTRRDTRTITFENSPAWAQVLMLAGVNIRTVDYDKNLQNTFNDVDTTINYLEKSINENRQQITIDREKGKISPSEYERRAAVVREQTSIWAQLQIDKMRLENYMKSQGVTPTNVLKELDRRKLRVRDLPLPGDEQLEDVARKVISVNRELRESDSSVP